MGRTAPRCRCTACLLGPAASCTRGSLSKAPRASLAPGLLAPFSGGAGAEYGIEAHAPPRAAVRLCREDYAAAAQLRDQLRAAEAADPVISAQRALEASIREERYEVRTAPAAVVACGVIICMYVCMYVRVASISIKL